MMSAQTATLTSGEIGTVVRAVSRAPSVHNSQPWQLRVDGATIDLLERKGVELRYHDPRGRDRMMSCGAALTHLELALRSLGRGCSISYPLESGVVARIVVGEAQPAEAAETALYRAIGRRRSHRRKFGERRVPAATVSSLISAGEYAGVRVVEPGRLDLLAEVLGTAARALRADKGYQRELGVWTAHTFGLGALGDGIPEDALSEDALPAAGLVRPATPIPDDAVLASRLAAETLLFVCTTADSRAEHLAAGAALERIWLAATSQVLAGSVITQPLQLTGVREELAGVLDLPGLPQAIFRCGYPAGAASPAPRLPLGELFAEDSTGGL